MVPCFMTEGCDNSIKRLMPKISCYGRDEDQLRGQNQLGDADNPFYQENPQISGAGRCCAGLALNSGSYKML